MDTLEWGNYDEELRDVEDFDLEQYGFQYDGGNFASSGFSNFGDPAAFEAMLSNETAMFYPQYFVKQESQPSIPQQLYARVKQEDIPGLISKEPLSPPSAHASYLSSSSMEPKKEGKRPRMSTDDEIDLEIDGQPPVEVRTRTPSETRTFTVNAKVLGNWKKLGGAIMRIALFYEKNDLAEAEQVKKDILGGTKTVPVMNDGSVTFDTLTISESSTKHKEREFSLELTLLRNDGFELLKKRTRPFYAYSHKKVLQRRGSVKLRTLSKSWGKISGGDFMHVIGSPFIQGPALCLIVRTPHGEVTVKPSEYYSDSVLFFDLPPYPLPEGVLVTPDMEFKVQILVTNDGRTFSNPLDFVYLSDNTGFRSRI